MLAQSLFWHETEHDIVVIPSISFPPWQLQKIQMIQHYEERMLYHLFHLRHSINSRILYITCLPLDPAILDYYVALIADSISGSQDYLQHTSRDEVIQSIKSRVWLLSTGDGTNLTSLTDKILNKPRVLKRIKNFISQKLSPHLGTHLSVYRGTEAEFKISDILKLPIHAADVSLLFWGGKAGSRSIFKIVNVPHCDGTYMYFISITVGLIQIWTLLYKKLLQFVKGNQPLKGECLNWTMDFQEMEMLWLIWKTFKKR